jgi:hypothetical protein
MARTSAFQAEDAGSSPATRTTETPAGHSLRGFFLPIAEPMAAAIGAGLPVAEALGSMATRPCDVGTRRLAAVPQSKDWKVAVKVIGGLPPEWVDAWARASRTMVSCRSRRRAWKACSVSPS